MYFEKIYRIAQNSGGVNICGHACASKLYLVVEDFQYKNINKSGWANDLQFAKFTKIFPRQNFVLYGI